MKYYAGIGARKTPNNMLTLMTKIARKLSHDGWMLRHGDAIGADTAFSAGADGRQEVYHANDATQEVIDLAMSFHGAPDKLSDYAKRLHGRNAFQILGRDLKTPSTFVICWTPDGCESHETRTVGTGGTGTAISIASAYNIKVFNLANRTSYERIIKWIEA